MGNFLVWVVWFIAVAVCWGSGIAVVAFRNPLYSALALIANLASLAVLFLLLAAEFVAAAQVLVYAGAVMVMFLFVIAYVGYEEEDLEAGKRWHRTAGLIAAGAILAEIAIVAIMGADDKLSDASDIGGAFGSPASIGNLFLTDHLLAFEVTSIVLLVAAVGGVVLGSSGKRAGVGKVR